MDKDLEELWPGGPVYRQTAGVFPLGTDSLLLADFVKTAGVRRAADLGCGAGALMLFLCGRSPALSCDGVELDPAAAALCRENLAANDFSARAGVVTGDLRDCRTFWAAGAYDLVVSNPPYFPKQSSASPDPARNKARSEGDCPLPALCAAAAYLCRAGGRFAVVHRPERLAELFCAMAAAGLEPKRLQSVCPRPDAAPSLILVEGRRGGRPGLVFEPPLVLRKE